MGYEFEATASVAEQHAQQAAGSSSSISSSNNKNAGV
jgi:hypothetical protein